MFRVSPFAVAIGLLGLGACAGPSVHFTDFYTVYDRGEVVYASRNGALKVEAFGRLSLETDLDAQALARAVAQTMSRHGPQWFRADYATEASEAVDSDYRLRWMFNVPAGFPMASACSDRVTAGAPEWVEATGLVVAAFCRGQRELSVARGSLGRPRTEARAGARAGARAWGAATLTELVAAMGRELLPQRNPDLKNDKCRVVPCS